MPGIDFTESAVFMTMRSGGQLSFDQSMSR